MESRISKYLWDILRAAIYIYRRKSPTGCICILNENGSFLDLFSTPCDKCQTSYRSICETHRLETVPRVQIERLGLLHVVRDRSTCITANACSKKASAHRVNVRTTRYCLTFSLNCSNKLARGYPHSGNCNVQPATNPPVCLTLKTASSS